jgi:hypothetical protein
VKKGVSVVLRSDTSLAKTERLYMLQNHNGYQYKPQWLAKTERLLRDYYNRNTIFFFNYKDYCCFFCLLLYGVVMRFFYSSHKKIIVTIVNNYHFFSLVVLLYFENIKLQQIKKEERKSK